MLSRVALEWISLELLRLMKDRWPHVFVPPSDAWRGVARYLFEEGLILMVPLRDGSGDAFVIGPEGRKWLEDVEREQEAQRNPPKTPQIEASAAVSKAAESS